MITTAVAAAVVRFEWTAGLRFDDLARAWLELVGERERRIVSSLRSDEDRRDLLAAHGLLRRAVGEWAGVDPASVTIDHDEHGRPVTDTASVDISLSHCRGLVACAVAGREGGAGSGLGVDAEPLASADRLTTFAGDYLARSELAWLDAEPGSRTTRLVQLWTAKEAVLKARGLGFGGADARSSFRSFVLSSAGGADGAELVSDAGERVWTRTIGGSHVLSLARVGSIGLGPPTIAPLSLSPAEAETGS